MTAISQIKNNHLSSTDKNHNDWRGQSLNLRPPGY